MAALQQFTATSKAREASYLNAAQKPAKTVTIVAPGETPPTPQPSPPVQQAADGKAAASATGTAPTAVSLENEDRKAAEASAQELATLRTKREKLQVQLPLWEGTDLEAAMKTHAAALDVKIEQLLATRQKALEPHQLQELLSLHRAELCTAMQAEAAAEAATKARLEAFDKKAKEVDEAYKADIEALLKAHDASQKVMLEERAALVTTLDASHAAAKTKVTALQARIETAQAQVNSTAITSATAADGAPVGVTPQLAPNAAVSTEVHKQQAMVHQQQVDALTAQLEAAQRNLAQQAEEAVAAALRASTELQQQKETAAAEAKRSLQQQTEANRATAEKAAADLQIQKDVAAQAAQRAAETAKQAADKKAKAAAAAATKAAKEEVTQRPSVLLPPAQLPSPAMPACEQAAQALYVLRDALRVLAMQEQRVPFTWADLDAAKLCWDDFCALVPFEITAQSVPGLVREKGPTKTDQVPRRTLECLRTQLDGIATQYATQNAASATVDGLRQQANAYAEQILDQAKRIQDRKRVAESTAESTEVQKAPKAPVPAETADSTAPAPAAPTPPATA